MDSLPEMLSMLLDGAVDVLDISEDLRKPVVVNAGSWVTTRDRTRYDAAAGVMIEGFATGLAPVDWQLELTRALGLVRKDRIVICQS